MQIYQLIYILLQMCLLLRNVYCDDDNIHEDITVFEEEDLDSIHSFFYKSAMEDLPSPVKSTKTSDKSIQQCNCKEQNEGNSQAAVFYKRLIAILLYNIFMQRIDDRLIAVVNIEASSSQYEYLQNFLNGKGSIREVDRILASVIKQSGSSTYRYMTEISYYFNVLSEHFMYYLSLMREHWDITAIFFVVTASFMILRKRKLSRGLVIFLMFDVIFVTSFFITWWRLIQEAEIKLMAAQTQFAEMPIACQPHKMGLWDKIIASLSSTNDCEKYYESIMTNPRLQVTPAFAMTHFISVTILHPVSYFGIVISEFINNATNKLDFLTRGPVTFFLFLSVCICIVLVPFFLFGGSFNLGFGPFLRFGIKRRSSEKPDRIERIYENISPKQLKSPEKITSGQDDLAGGDTHTHTTCNLNDKCKQCENADAENEDVENEDIDCEKKENGDGDC